MPFCRNCGAKLPDNAKFCNKCGTKVLIHKEPTIRYEDDKIYIDVEEGATVEIIDPVEMDCRI